jgi:putative component of toxin-antitoxin plasmid stabilization module
LGAADERGCCWGEERERLTAAEQKEEGSGQSGFHGVVEVRTPKGRTKGHIMVHVALLLLLLVCGAYVSTEMAGENDLDLSSVWRRGRL